MATTKDAGRVGFVLKGNYNPSTQYERLDVVFSGDSTYVAKKDTLGNDPTDTEFWQLAAGLDKHALTPITDEESVHNIRYFGQRLQARIDDEWVNIDGASISEMRDLLTSAEEAATLAKNYADNAQAIVGVDISTPEKAGINKPDDVSIHVTTDGIYYLDPAYKEILDNLIKNEILDPLLDNTGDPILDDTGEQIFGLYKLTIA